MSQENTLSEKEFIRSLESVVGKRYVLTDHRATRRFRRGFRSGEGDALAVVQPGTLLELWLILQACVGADRVVILQAANTGLTEGSTPKGSYDRDVVLINTRRMDQLHLLDNGRQVLSFPGATLFALERLLAPLGRQPHSVIGSSCIGASVVGGICNSSGGSLVERGPAYTELSLFARITDDGTLELVNHLGIDLGETAEEILVNLQRGNFNSATVEDSNLKASDTDYARRVRQIDADTPARFNADKRRLYEAAGCAGKLAVFAVRLDTYQKNKTERTFYIGARNTSSLTELRRRILSDIQTLPVSAEYMHRDVFDISDSYGKDTIVLIDRLGTDYLPLFFAIKGSVDAWLAKIPGLGNFTDRFMQFAMKLWPDILPERMRNFRKLYPHHLILKMRDDGIEDARSLLSGLQANDSIAVFECNPREAKIAELLRFAAAGAAVRYMAVHHTEVEDILSLDIALRRNDQDWFENLPANIANQFVGRLYYGHFMCHVLHQDYIVKKGADPQALKTDMLEILDARGAEYPAEHNVGHIYHAKPDLAAFYRQADPTNSMNPGIGKMSRKKNYA